MKIKDKIKINDRHGLAEHGPINVVILGDSVSHGAFKDYIDYEKVYWNLLRRKLNAYNSYVPVNMINVSIGGTFAREAVGRVETQVLNHTPDLIIVCFGLNDVNGSLEEYVGALGQIFEKCLPSGADIIFMTPNMLNTYVAEDAPTKYLKYAAKTADMQNGGRMDEYMAAAKATAESMGIAVCDCYAKWKELSKTQDVTMLLDNRINHPTPEMHELFAAELYSMIMEEQTEVGESDSTMYE